MKQISGTGAHMTQFVIFDVNLLCCSYLLAMSLQQEQQMTDEELAWKHSQQQEQQVQMSE